MHIFLLLLDAFGKGFLRKSADREKRNKGAEKLSENCVVVMKSKIFFGKTCKCKARTFFNANN